MLLHVKRVAPGRHGKGEGAKRGLNNAAQEVEDRWKTEKVEDWAPRCAPTPECGAMGTEPLEVEVARK